MHEVAVVIPARDAGATLGLTLAALSHQDAESEPQVVVVDDASTDETAEIARGAGATVVRMDAPVGPAAARNAGVAAARAELIAFTDADCVPAPAWLREGTAALVAGADLVTGPVLPISEPGPFDRTLRITGPTPLFESANLFCRRETLERIGGFRRPDRLPRSIPHFGEDVELGWRAARAGARIGFAPAATVHHAVFERDARGYIAERLRLRLFPLLARECPELRTAMPHGVFLSPRTMRADLALAGVLVSIRRRSVLPLAAAVPYVRAGLDWRRPWRRSALRFNLAQVAADGVGLAALAWGSARHRRIVL